MKRNNALVLSLLALGLTATAAEPEIGSANLDDGYTLVWQDLFNAGELNRDRWNVQVVSNPANNELQYYRDNEANVRVGLDDEGNSCLILTAIREEYNTRHFTSGRVTTEGKVNFTHGKIEASLKIPKTYKGLWPAFWMMGEDYGERGWPRCGETDIMEMGNSAGFRKNEGESYFNGACHWGFYNEDWQYPNYAKASNWDYSLQDGEFHLFTCYWTPDYFKMYVDLDKYPDSPCYFEMGITTPEGEENDPSQDIDWSAWRYFHKPQHILLNLAVGGHFPGITKADGITALNDENGQQASYYINYVKVYQRGSSVDPKETLYSKVPGDSQEEAIENLTVDNTNAPVEFFTLDGREVKNPSTGLFIRRQGSNVEKAIIK